MLALLLLAVQDIPGPPSDDPEPRLLRKCEPGEGGEIVVCARDSDQFRLRPLGPPPGSRSGLPDATVSLPGGARAVARTEAGGPAGAFTRVMVDFVIPF